MSESSDPDPWAEYQRIQEALLRRDHLDDIAWGLEAALDRSLRSASREDVCRAASNASRKERYRARLRRLHLHDEPVRSVEQMAIAREQLQQIRMSVSLADLDLLEAVACGARYAEIAVESNTNSGALRVRVLRLRQRLRCLWR